MKIKAAITRQTGEIKIEILELAAPKAGEVLVLTGLVGSGRTEIVRCIFDSLALRYRWTVEKMDEMKGKRTPFINIVGGGTKEAPLCQLAADACGRPVYAGPVEATAIGNIAVQAIAAGEIKNVAEAREVVRNSFDIDHYEPKGNADMWDDGYARFCKLIGE